MNDCRYKSMSRSSRRIALFFYPAIGLLVIACGIWAGIDTILTGGPIGYLVYIILLTSVVGCFLLRLSVLCYTLENRKFALSEAGITLSDKKKSFYDWSEVCEVAIMPFAASASLQNYELVICCFLKPNTDKCSQKIMRSYLYAARHQDAFVVIDHSPDVLEKFSSAYPGTIIDRSMISDHTRSAK